ncbi:hypothetical protein [Pseudobacteroides cellulosolvens]|uniref:Uncharacterized protein n=1 Tax=Pseudobacteroides cellulosolvens ATCC 35603 = DSM 2933 TaxID=398512 RepID=A0A0L6JQJ7_9FIRM|nr:hypothetical protein [Pseudobacteroides cellulosolvens]KNY28064.1 hypothetical protein Bccel_3335 [Pseudobacteroides cellulosolvens ATCC 35603 = DSM 2933]
MDKKKLRFWRLAITFVEITILALIVSYGYGYRKQASMMNKTMGNMMSSMHLGNITLSDMIKEQEQIEGLQEQNQSQSHNSHHSQSDSFLTATHYLTTATIVILLPFIIAGSVFLAIIWLK